MIEDKVHILLSHSWIEWGDSDDILEYCERKKDMVQLIILENDAIKSMNSEMFIKHVYFCDTIIVQDHLNNLNKKDFVPDTYDERFKDHFHRTIKRMKHRALKKWLNFPLFIKPAKNDKDFDGSVVNDYAELCEIFEMYNINPDDDYEFYVSNIVNFKGDYRLLIGDGKVYAKGSDNGNANRISIDIDEVFVEQIIDCSKGEFFVIDVAFMNDAEWAIVEVNPPFSIDDWGIDTDTYMDYCIRACMRSRNFT